MKTLKDWEENKSELELTQYVEPLDEIDWPLYEHILCGFMAPKYDNGTVGQGGDPHNEEDGVYTYATVMTVKDKYYYLGVLPEFKTPE